MASGLLFVGEQTGLAARPPAPHSAAAAAAHRPASRAIIPYPGSASPSLSRAQCSGDDCGPQCAVPGSLSISVSREFRRQQKLLVTKKCRFSAHLAADLDWESCRRRSLLRGSGHQHSLPLWSATVDIE